MLPDMFLYVDMVYHFSEEMPGEWKESLDDFQQLLVLRCLRPDKLTNAMQDYVARHLGQRFIEPQVFN